MPAPTATFVVLATLAAVLATSAVAKLRDPRASEDAFVSLRVPSFVPRRTAARTVPWVEAGLALLLVLAPSPVLVVVAALVALLVLAYTGLVARALTFDAPVDCACFGALGSQRVDAVTVARNLVLLALVVAATWLATRGASLPGSLRALDADGWWTVLAATAAVVVAMTIVGLPGDSTGAAEQVGVGEVLDYERRPIPYGVLARPDATSATLAELASTQARLLVVLSPHCGPCVRTAEKLDAWAERLAPAVGVVAVYPETWQPDASFAHAEELAMVEPDANVRRVFSVGTPGAVLLGADGLLAGGPVAGEGSIERFVEEIIASVADQPNPTG